MKFGDKFSMIKVNSIDIKLNINLPIETKLVLVVFDFYFYNLFLCYPLYLILISGPVYLPVFSDAVIDFGAWLTIPTVYLPSVQ